MICFRPILRVRMRSSSRSAGLSAAIASTAAESEAQYRALLIEKLKFTIRKLRHEQFGQSSEHGALLDQLELQLADLEEDAAQATRRPNAAAAATRRLRCRRSNGASRRGVRCPSICRASASSIPRLRSAHAAAVGLAQDRRGCDRDAGAHSATVESDPACAREVLLPGLRSDHPAAGALAPDRARARRAEAARPYSVLQVRPAPAAQPPERHLCAGRHRSRRVDARRLGRRGGGNADAAGRGDPHPCLRG